MSLTYGFYNSVGGDRRYNADQMSSLFDGLIKDGVFVSIGDKLAVSASTGMNVVVGTGRAWFNRTWTYNDALIVLPIAPAEVVLKRIDSVILEINAGLETRANAIKIVKGTPAGTPVAPTLVNTELIHQYALANILVEAGITEILASKITNLVGTVSCPFVTGLLETTNVDFLFSQWGGEFDDWFNGVRDTLTTDAAGNLNAKIDNKVTTGTATIPTTGWVANVGDSPLKLDLSIVGVSLGNWVDVTIDKDYQDVAQTAEINGTIEEYEGGITFFAKVAPSVDIPIRYKVVR